ncbi:hypothetical protein AQUCO_00800252v1 [Aquilegia coerulea]|uniref:Ubiquitin-like protease family profile domain-containing protein n=1 Tax=Aquilegia coerulea TaxID=218851 RepID=A0A2G5EIF2_AQUCA|nr:hypothetical protein AQUCO_00800252v1 [Aquilegia coerulea]
MRGRKGVDKYFDDTNIMRDEVVKILNKMKIDSKKWSSLTEPITQPYCPRQGDTVDCGLYVCKFMELFSQEAKMNKTIDLKKDIDELKLTLAHLIIADKEKNWKIEDAIM